MAAELYPHIDCKRAVKLEDLLGTSLDVLRALECDIEIGISSMEIFLFGE